jgi:hypothetical protein
VIFSAFAIIITNPFLKETLKANGALHFLFGGYAILIWDYLPRSWRGHLEKVNLFRYENVERNEFNGLGSMARKGTRWRDFEELTKEVQI